MVVDGERRNVPADVDGDRDPRRVRVATILEAVVQ